MSLTTVIMMSLLTKYHLFAKITLSEICVKQMLIIVEMLCIKSNWLVSEWAAAAMFYVKIAQNVVQKLFISAFCCSSVLCWRPTHLP